MDIKPLQSRHIDLSNLPLERVASSTQLTEKEKVGEVSRAFEAVLLRQILQESQKPVFSSKFIGNSTTDGIYRDLVVNQLAESISKSGSFGLARSLAGELQRQATAVNPAKSRSGGASPVAAAASGRHPAASLVRPKSISQTRPGSGMTPQSQPHKAHLQSPKHE